MKLLLGALDFSCMCYSTPWDSSALNPEVLLPALLASSVLLDATKEIWFSSLKYVSGASDPEARCSEVLGIILKEGTHCLLQNLLHA